MANQRQDDVYDRWYLRALAVFYGLLCGISSIRYLYLDLNPSSGYVPWTTQVVCFGAAVGTILYFVNPRIGHHCLVATTVLVLMMFAPSGEWAATSFHLVVLGMLYVPLMKRRREVEA